MILRRYHKKETIEELEVKPKKPKKEVGAKNGNTGTSKDSNSNKK